MGDLTKSDICPLLGRINIHYRRTCANRPEEKTFQPLLCPQFLMVNRRLSRSTVSVAIHATPAPSGDDIYRALLVSIRTRQGKRI